ncbi:YphA family membrane protein [Paenibacillus sp. y28]|uniref:YphA family membrane protein n=1 Tax=Paenibacillus sp. y28 TaxID=3129110 RepID=UPI003019EC01
MNPGILSYLLLAIVIILLASGWKNTLLANWPMKGWFVFLCGWAILVQCQFTLHKIPVNGAFLWLSAAGLLFLGLAVRQSASAQVLGYSALLSSLYYLMKHLLLIDPVFLAQLPHMDAALVLGLCSAVLVHDATRQMGLITISVLAGEVLFYCWHGWPQHEVLGGLAFQDSWWLACLSGRTLSAGAAACLGMSYRKEEQNQ